MATMLAWALNVTAVKWLTAYLDELEVAGLRMACAAVVIVLLVRAAGWNLPRLRGRGLALALVCALLMVYVNQLLFATAMERTSASNAALILALNPLLNGLMEAWLLRKRLSGSWLAGAVIAVAGVLMVVLNRPGTALAGPSTGDLLVLASMLSFTLGILSLQRLAREHAPLALNAFMYLVGTAALLLHMVLVVPEPVAHALALGWPQWLVVLFSGAVATALGAAAWARGIVALGVARAAVYMSWVPILGVGFSALLLGEPLTAWHLAGTVLVLAGTLTSSLGPPALTRRFGT